MKLIRWIFSNIILIIFVLALTYAYVYWDNLTGEDTPAGKVITYLSEEFDEVREYIEVYSGDDEERVAQVDATEVEKAGEPAAVVAPPVSVPQVQPPPRRSAPAPEMRPPTRPQMPPQAMAPEMTPPARPQMPPQMMAPEMTPPERPQMPPQAMAPEMTPPARPQMPPMMPEPPMRREMMPPPPMQKPETKPAQPTTTREIWINARKEYHRGNIEASIKNYKEVIARSSDNYDAYGELGNVYLRQGKRKEAAGAYFDAAAILVKLGQKRRASSLLPMLSRLDSAKAKELNQLLTSSKTSS